MATANREANAVLTKIQPASSKKSVVPFGRHEFKHDAYIASVSFSPDSKYIAAGGYDKKVTIYELSSKKISHEFRQNDYVFFLYSFLIIIKSIKKLKT